MTRLAKYGAAWWPGGAIVLAVLLAHGGCLDSIFYLDDWNQVFSNSGVEGGKWWLEQNRILTVLSYRWTWLAVGFSTFWFHAFNLLLHAVGALAIYYLGPFLLEARTVAGAVLGDRERWTAWLAALIFAVHPMTTELTNYVRARDHGLVGLFSFLAACFVAMAVKRDWKWAGLSVLAVVLASISKGPGFAHALLCVGLTLLACTTWPQWCSLLKARRRVLAWGLVAVGGALVILHSLVFSLFVIFQRAFLHAPRLGIHSLTQCRVFWESVKLLIWPTRLCSDHLVAWTSNSGDRVAWIAAVALVLLAGAVAGMWVKRWQPAALLATLALGAICLRFLYVVSELMVEYRMYPALPYLALLVALGLVAVWRRLPRITTVGTALLLLWYGILSAKRSEDWETLPRLTESILKNHRWQLRAFNGLSSQDVRDGNWEGILGRYAEFSKRLGEVMAENKTNPTRFYENWALWVVCEECMVTEALMQVHGVYTARKFHDKLSRRMQENRLDTHSLLLGLWEMVAGKIELAAGNRDEAQVHFAKARGAGIFDVEIDQLLGTAPRN